MRKKIFLKNILSYIRRQNELVRQVRAEFQNELLNVFLFSFLFSFVCLSFLFVCLFFLMMMEIYDLKKRKLALALILQIDAAYAGREIDFFF